ncbi:hypothetical protein C5B42_04390 [Candidatus Cerribacteria bacterium 'Amazon FNV 2010 28 9']|uniref:N-acetyltransferase domain-containing protein n=1 Tax=Candidatus Cerribacteria bacterium 'Amazon FNV 2010 28 9' TaxID=2081795 RepID=A0A317JN70_9BACT|nr:MAG: hypothetical protein C5B42_04390 [Candidatus Cerribacteria bacterium 'Amazon FNV 2010 28 9']
MQKIEQTSFEKYYDIKSAAELGVLAQAIAECVSSAFQGGVTEEDTIRHMSGDIIMVNREHNSDRVNAFSATVFASPNEIFNSETISDQKGAYFAAATVRKEAQGRGLYKAMNVERVLEALDTVVPLIFTRTQNPRVQAGIEAVLEQLVESNKIGSYRTERIKVPGAYGQMLTKEKPYSDSISFDELNLEAGDAYIILFHIDYGTAR